MITADVAAPPLPRTSHRRHANARAFPWAFSATHIAAILVIQTVLSIRLLYSSIASGDEALYIYSGHQLIRELWHGGGSPYYETYFSGAPVIYPVLAAMVDQIGGLVLVRLMSCVFMLVATGLLFMTARQIFGYWPAVTGAGLFVALGITQGMGVLATYDAMALMLMALAAWSAVRAANSTGWFLAVPAILLLANATKYPSLLFDSVVIVLAGLRLREEGWRRVGQRITVLSSVTVSLIVIAVALAGTSYLKGIMFTTLARSSGQAGVQFGWDSATPLQVAKYSWSLMGIVVCLGFAALAVSLLLERRVSIHPIHAG